MTKRFEERLTRLENKLRTRTEPLPGGDVVMTADDGVIKSCFALTPGPVPAGPAGFYERQQWRSRDTCERADACEHAGHCTASAEA